MVASSRMSSLIGNVTSLRRVQCRCRRRTARNRRTGAAAAPPRDGERENPAALPVDVANLAWKSPKREARARQTTGTAIGTRERSSRVRRGGVMDLTTKYLGLE